MKTVNSRSATVHDEVVGEAREGKRDNVEVSVSYHKRRGYYLQGRVTRLDESGCMSFMMFNGIDHLELLEHATRFGKKKLATLAEALRGSERLSGVVGVMKKELARRIAAEESY